MDIACLPKWEVQIIKIMSYLNFNFNLSHFNLAYWHKKNFIPLYLFNYQ